MGSAFGFAQPGASERLTRSVGILAGRLAQMLAGFSGAPEERVGQSKSFLWAAYQAATNDPSPQPTAGSIIEPSLSEVPDPINRLAISFGLSDQEVELLLLAGMPEEHEGFSAVLRSLNPSGESRVSLGLAAQLLFTEPGGRRLCRDLVEDGPLFRNEIVRLGNVEAPLFDRCLWPAEALWAALHGTDSWPRSINPAEARTRPQGLEEWFAKPLTQRAIKAVRSGLPCTIAVSGDNHAVAHQRAIALVLEAGRRPAASTIPSNADVRWQQLLNIHAALRGAVPVLRVSPDWLPGDDAIVHSPGPVVVATAGSPGLLARTSSLICVPVEPLSSAARRTAWAMLIPELAGEASYLAARYPLEPFQIADTALDLAAVQRFEQRTPTTSDVAESLRSRAHRNLSAGIKLVRPKASWQDLVLPADLIVQLHEAVDRLRLKSRVIDEWGFLRNRTGAHSVRMLFSGPPGTGKTLSAEVLANALEAELLIVDVSRVVSKWVGETEKNLSAIFDAAETSQAVLLFDEADALFAKRTEVSDARDRYANLETAYLLQRLERFDGLAVLATNLRQNIDAAFIRRLEFVLDFTEPDREQRIALWKRHVPEEVPRASDLSFAELAALYPVAGGVIRNAAVAAAYRAAADGLVLRREHFFHAIRREYEKAGKAFPGLPAPSRA